VGLKPAAIEAPHVEGPRLIVEAHALIARELLYACVSRGMVGHCTNDITSVSHSRAQAAGRKVPYYVDSSLASAPW
jgi:hypothetical protein